MGSSRRARSTKTPTHHWQADHNQITHSSQPEQFFQYPRDHRPRSHVPRDLKTNMRGHGACRMKGRHPFIRIIIAMKRGIDDAKGWMI